MSKRKGSTGGGNFPAAAVVPKNSPAPLAQSPGSKQSPAARKAAKVAKKKPTFTVKTVFDTPFTVRWSGVGERQNDEILTRMRKELSQYKTEKRGRKKVSQRQQLKKARKEEPASGNEQTTNQPSEPKVDEKNTEEKITEKGVEVEGKPKANDYLCLGINHVTRALERDELCLVVVCKDAEPPRLVQHIPYLAYLKQVPLCALAQRGSTFELGKVFGLKTMLALGFKKRRDSPHRELIEFIQARTPELDIPWLVTGRDIGVTTTKMREGKRKEQEEEEGEKEKKDAMEVSKEGGECKLKLPTTLQPLRIKQVTAKRPRLENK